MSRGKPETLPDPIPTTEPELYKLKIPQLKAILRSLKLKVSGRKAELVERIMTAGPSVSSLVSSSIRPPEIGGESILPGRPPVESITKKKTGIAFPSVPLAPVRSSISIRTPPPPKQVTSPTGAALPPVPSVPSIKSPLPPVPSIKSPLPPVPAIRSPLSVPPPIRSPLPPPVRSPLSVPPPLRSPLGPVPSIGSPLPAPSVPFPKPTVLGVEGLTKDLGGDLAPPTSLGVPGVPSLPGPSELPSTLTAVPGRKMPPLENIVPTQAIQLPPPRALTSPLPVSQEEAERRKTALTQPPKASVGPGGLPMRTDLSTLNQLRRTVNVPPGINPEAAYQKRTEIPRGKTVPLPTTKPAIIRPISDLPGIITSPGRQPVVRIESPLPTGRRQRKKPSQAISLPKIKETVSVPSEVGKIKLPTDITLITPVALKSPAAVPESRSTGVAVAYTPQQQVVENIMGIDISKLNTKRATKDNSSYTTKELKAIAGSLNLPKSGTKKELVDRITATIKKIKPDAFTDQ